MYRQVFVSDLPFLEPGEVLSTFANGVEHFGHLTDRHLHDLPPSIISASKILGFVAEEHPLRFAPNGQIFAHGHWSPQARMRTVQIARFKLGQPYRLFSHNCEHFVRICQGLPAESPQLTKAFSMVLAAGALIGFAKLVG